MVNMLLTGQASSNTFDGQVVLKQDGITRPCERNGQIDDNHDQGTQLVLKGIDKQSDIGLLSLFEHYKSIKVGNNLKNPKFPIWVICSESHFTVLFSISRESR